MADDQTPPSPGLDREEPDLWVEDDIPTPAADAEEEGQDARDQEGARG
ncbi:MAG TPA: hypothetical protein VFE82_11595 [Ramlibacter sp.]|jgi:hypothetical protein|nr:hypothetical protein [Ramlibacter sp.]HZY19115.1 hypothetical protein [Ramlibacter sp.]